MTTTTVRSKFSSRKGVSLAELMVAIALTGLIVATSTGSLVFLAKSTKGLGNYQEMNMDSRFALEEFASDARMTADVNSISTTAVSLDVYDSAGNTNVVTYSYDSTDRTFYKTTGSTKKAMLEDVESLSLTYYQLNGQVEVSGPEEVKMIQIHATLKRDVMTVSNTNEIITARYMMRNRAVSQ